MLFVKSKSPDTRASTGNGRPVLKRQATEVQMKIHYYNQGNNPENYWPDDQDTQIEAFNRHGQSWDALSSNEQEDIIDDLIAEHYSSCCPWRF